MSEIVGERCWIIKRGNMLELCASLESGKNGELVEAYANQFKKLVNENQAFRELVKNAIDRGLIMESCSENDWDVACDDWLKKAKEIL